MQEFRNSELKAEISIYILITLLSAIIGTVFQTASGILILISGCFFIVVHLFFSKKRYKKICQLYQSVEQVLHGQKSLLISNSNEGELAILHSEIHKMTIKLKEQSDLLKKDKIRLTVAIEDIFHQIRTPLTSLNLLVSLLTEENLSYERRIRLTRDLKRQIERIKWLVETLLKMSKIDAGAVSFRKDLVCVEQLIKKSCEPFLVPIEVHGQNLNISVSDEKFVGDLAWTTEAIANLVKNCMEHTPEGGTINISATETALFTEIVVQDSGSGFNKEDIPYLFERFYKGKNSNSDSIGIGLSLCRMIIVRQNGIITAQNAKDGGAQFIIKFYKGII